MIDQIISLHQEMQTLTLQAGVPPDQYHEMLDLDIRDSDEELKQKLDLLTSVKENEYAKVMEIWSLLKPEHWEGYILHEITGLREQRLLEEARKNLRKRWKNLYENA